MINKLSRRHLADYLQHMRQIRGQATPEISYYSPLMNLFNAIGEEMRPPVKAIGQIRDVGFGIPDFGLLTAEQLKLFANGSKSEKPDRGVVEAKSLAANIDELLKSTQVEKYARGYGLVLITNYRQFLLAEMQNGKVTEIARCQIAADEDEFWQKAAHPQKTANECGNAVYEFLHRALLHNAPLTCAADVAAILASYARESLAILEQNKDESSLQSLRTALENSLNMKFVGDDGEHFFLSTLSQTIFYGLFSAWMETKKDFDWQAAQYSVKTPVMKDLFAEIVAPNRLGKLGLQKSLAGAAIALNRVTNKKELFGGKETSETIQYFYEPFLAKFDPQLRKELGVWYTPPEIVRYMVERADRVLRKELKIPDGLAAKEVYVLDPCGGTGAYIAEVLRRIYKTCQERGDGDLAAQTVKAAAQERILGFEILSASYIVAHWQIGALLANMGAPFNNGERAAIYLTNSLTNWEDIKDEQQIIGFPGLQKERDDANDIKRQKPILVILGNPPYNAFAGTSPKEEENLVAPYKTGLISEWGIKKFNLDDLYVRFFRMAENRIGKTGQGIVSFISNYSYTEKPSFVVMRQSLLKNFNKIWIENMHGNRNITERTPDGQSSDTIFAMRGFSPGIRQGITISLLAKNNKSTKPALVQYRNDIDAAKADERRKQLLDSLNVPNFNAQYEIVKPTKQNKFLFCPYNVSDEFLQWAELTELFKDTHNGMAESRGGALIDINKESLTKRMRDYFNADLDWESYRQKGGGLAKNAARFDATKARKKAIMEGFNPKNIVAYTMKPFDNGFCYYTNTRPVWNEHRPGLWQQYKRGNAFLISRNRNAIGDEGAPMFFTSCIGDNSVLGSARFIPFYFYTDDSLQGKTKTANLSAKAREYLQSLGFANPDTNQESAEMIWLHALAIGYSPAYQKEHVDGLKIGWPRIPLPTTAKKLKQSAALGKKIRAILDMQTPFVADEFTKHLATPKSDNNGDMSDLWAADYWGYKDNKGKTYPGKGKTATRRWTEYFPTPAKKQKAAWELLGEPLDIILNDKGIKWEQVPKAAWEYKIGGFQVAKKWLSYRAAKVLTRPLTPEEIKTQSQIIKRISALILMKEDLDGNYLEVKLNSVCLMSDSQSL